MELGGSAEGSLMAMGVSAGGAGLFRPKRAPPFLLRYPSLLAPLRAKDGVLTMLSCPHSVLTTRVTLSKSRKSLRASSGRSSGSKGVMVRRSLAHYAVALMKDSYDYSCCDSYYLDL